MLGAVQVWNPDDWEFFAQTLLYGRLITMRTQTTGMVGSVFQATGIALPANIRE